MRPERPEQTFAQGNLEKRSTATNMYMGRFVDVLWMGPQKSSWISELGSDSFGRDTSLVNGIIGFIFLPCFLLISQSCALASISPVILGHQKYATLLTIWACWGARHVAWPSMRF